MQAGFFLTYLLTKGILAGSIKFLRVPGAVISWILGKFSTSERAKKRTWANQYMSYGVKVPGDAMAILILLVFAFVQPLVAVAATLYFMLASLYWKYDMMYSYRDSFQTGGMFWPVVCSSTPCECASVPAEGCTRLYSYHIKEGRARGSEGDPTAPVLRPQ